MIELECTVEGCPEDLGEFLNRVADACFAVEGIQNAGFYIRVVDDETIRTINRETRKLDQVTDVLSFPTIRYPAGTTARQNPQKIRREYDPSLGYSYLGDCILNLNRAKLQAEEYGHSLRRELGYLTAHSAFHLMGYDHMTEPDKKIMRAQEEKAMNALCLTRDSKD